MKGLVFLGCLDDSLRVLGAFGPGKRVAGFVVATPAARTCRSANPPALPTRRTGGTKVIWRPDRIIKRETPSSCSIYLAGLVPALSDLAHPNGSSPSSERRQPVLKLRRWRDSSDHSAERRRHGRVNPETSHNRTYRPETTARRGQANDRALIGSHCGLSYSYLAGRLSVSKKSGVCETRLQAGSLCYRRIEMALPPSSRPRSDRSDLCLGENP
jgi:hypothetical protein